MKADERDELLGRLDERTANTYHLVEKQEKHLSELNERVNVNVTDIHLHNQRLKTLEQGVNLKLTKKQATFGGGGLITLIAALLVAVGKILGWW